jgi:hypothetical protein
MGRDIATTDPKLPICNDQESDNEDGGVDPLCIRYDNQKDPTQSVSTALARANLDAITGDITLAGAVRRVPDLVLTADVVAAADSADKVSALADELAKALSGSVGFYVVTGKESIYKTVSLNLRSLLEFEDGILPDGYDELAMRQRVFSGLQQSLAMKALPDAALTGLKDAAQNGVTLLMAAPVVSTLSQADRDALTKTVSDRLARVAGDFASADSGLPKLRAQLLTQLARHDAVPYFFGTLEATTIDLENDVLGLLSASLLDKSVTATERKNAATSLATFKGRLHGQPAIDAAVTALQQERLTATTSGARELVEALLASLQ